MKKKKVSSVILALLLCVSFFQSMIPVGVSAEEEGGQDKTAVIPAQSVDETGIENVFSEPRTQEGSPTPDGMNEEKADTSGMAGSAVTLNDEAADAGKNETGGREEKPQEKTGTPNAEEILNQAEENTQEAVSTAAYAEKITLDIETAALDALDQVQLSAQIYPEDCDQTVSWSSSDPTVATVDENGLVTAVGRGAAGSGLAIITAAAAAGTEDGSLPSASCSVTVRSDGTVVSSIADLGSEHPYRDGENRFWEFGLVGADNLSISFAQETSLGAGDFLLLQFGDNGQYTYSPDNISSIAGKSVAIPGNTVRIWLVSDHDGYTGWGFQVVSVTEAQENEELVPAQDFTNPLENLDVPPLMTGNSITAAAGEDGLLGAPADPETPPTASITLDRNELSMEALDRETLTASVDPADNPNLTIAWSSSDENVAAVIDGEVQAKSHQGIATITAAVLYDNGSGDTTAVLDADGQPAAASCTVTVTNDAVEVTDWAKLESEHPYSRPVNQFWQYEDPNASSLTLTFDAPSSLALPDTVTVTDGSKNPAGIFTGNLLSGRTVTVYDNTVRIYLQSTQTGAGDWGFKVTNVYAAAGTPKYTVRYYANGGTNAPEQQTKTEDVPLTLSEEKPVRSHYTFLGWATERTSGRVAWYPGDEYDENANLTLYAVWDRISVFDSTNRGSSSTPYYGPTGSATQIQSYPHTPIELERSEGNYDKEVLHIRTVEDLIAFSENCSLDTWSNRLPVVLDNDLSVSDVDFQPIPLFNGSFDGRGHSIFDLKVTDPMAPCGFFLETGQDAIIKNLSVTGVVTPGGDNNMTGGLVGLNRGSIQNCSFTGTVTGKLETGGLVGRNEVTGIVTGCRSTTTVSGLNQTGAICGMNYGTLLSCESSCYVNTESVDPALNLDDIDTSSVLNFFHSLNTETAGITTDTGGICGYNEGFIEACVSKSAVGYSRLGYNVGGIAGRSKGYINGSRNEGAVYGRKDVGGITGQAEPYVEVTQPGSLTAGLSYRVYALHKSINDAIHDADVLSSDLSDQLSSLSGFLNPIEQAFRELSLSDPESVDGLRTVIVDTVSGMAGQLQSMSDSLGEGSSVLKEDLQAISGNLGALYGSALQTVDLLSSSQNEDIIVDESAEATADAITLGKITDCRNLGEINGETNVGGIAGVMALENALDPDLDLTSTDAVLRKRFSYRSVISRSVNDAAVYGWYECVGGIAGKADIGYITNCAAYKSVGLEDGAYAGGIAGLCYGTVQNCVSRCSLKGTKYVGGILGNGYTATGQDDRPSEVSSCYALVEIEERPQFSGAISGGAEGRYQNNYFVPAGFAGLNRISIFGEAEPMLFSVFDSLLTLPEESKVFTLRFVVDGETVKEVSFDYGASFGREVFPILASRDGAYAVWDRTDLTDLRFDTTVTASYRRSETALGTALTRENGRPAAYVIGQFQESDTVTAEILPIEDDDLKQFRPGWLQTAKEQIRSVFHEPDYSICVAVAEKLRLSFPEDGQETHTIHYMSPDGRTTDYRLYLKTEEGYERLRAEVFGSYYSFETAGTAPEICLVTTVQSWWFVAYLAGAILILILLVSLFVRIVRIMKQRPRHPARQRKESKLGGWIRGHRKRFILLCIIFAAVLLGAGVVLQTGWLQSGFAGYRILKTLTTEEMDFRSEISIRMGEEEVELASTLQQISEDDNMILCADQYGIDVYLVNGTLYLENGRAFRLMNNQIDQRQMLHLALNAVRRGHVVREEVGEIVRYRTEIDSEAAEDILTLYLSEDIGNTVRIDEFFGEMDVQNGTLTEIRFVGKGLMEDETEFSFLARLQPEPLSERPVVPQTVLDAVRSGGEGSEFMTGDMLRLFAAWIKNDRADTVDATITVNADCGVLSLDDSYSYFRQDTEGTGISCVSSHLFRIYFTDKAACTADGNVLSTAETRLLDAAEIIPLIRELFLQGDYSCEELGSGQMYSLSLEADRIGGIVESIIPELADLKITYEDCVLNASIRDGSLYSLGLNCGGTVRIVTRDVETSITVMVQFIPPNDHTIPAAVRKTLVQNA